MQLEAEKLPKLYLKMPRRKWKKNLDRIYLSGNRVFADFHEREMQQIAKEKSSRELRSLELRLCFRIDSCRDWKRNVILYQTAFRIYFQPEIVIIN